MDVHEQGDYTIWTACTISQTLMTALHIHRIDKGKQQESTKGKTLSTIQNLIPHFQKKRKSNAKQLRASHSKTTQIIMTLKHLFPEVGIVWYSAQLAI